MCIILSLLCGDVTAQRSELRTLVLDAGHGGADPGAAGQITHEAAVALGITLKLGKLIAKAYPDMKIVYTRTTDVLAGGGRDVNRSIRYRADLANRVKGNLFISIHCNSNGRAAGGYYAKTMIGHRRKVVVVKTGRKKHRQVVIEPVYRSVWVKNVVKGTATYIWAADRSGSKGGIINEEAGGERVKDTTNLLDLSSPEARIRAQLYEKKYFANSMMLASMVEDEFRKSGRVSKGVAQRNNKGIWVLQATAMPSILIETGFVTNTEEEKYLHSSSGQAQIARGILNALRRYRTMTETIQ